MFAKLEELREPQMRTYSNLLWNKEQSPFFTCGVFYKCGAVFFPIRSFPELFPGWSDWLIRKDFGIMLCT